MSLDSELYIAFRLHMRNDYFIGCGINLLKRFGESLRENEQNTLWLCSCFEPVKIIKWKLTAYTHHLTLIVIHFQSFLML